MYIKSIIEHKIPIVKINLFSIPNKIVGAKVPIHLQTATVIEKYLVLSLRINKSINKNDINKFCKKSSVFSP